MARLPGFIHAMRRRGVPVVENGFGVSVYVEAQSVSDARRTACDHVAVTWDDGNGFPGYTWGQWCAKYPSAGGNDYAVTKVDTLPPFCLSTRGDL